MRLLRPAALTAVLGLAGAGVVTLAPASTAATTTPNVTTLTSYVKAPLVGGDHYEPFGAGFSDVGLTIDGALALAATGTDDATVQKIADYVDAHGRDYYDPTDPTDPTTSYLGVGSAGKVALLAEVAHRDPRAFAGGDLIALIDDHVCTAATVKSDPSNCPAAGAFFGSASVFKQALPIIAAARAGSAPAAAVSYLLSIQNPDGSWPSLIPPGTSPDSDPDSTALAVQALSLLPDPSFSGTYAAAAAKGIAFLAATQNGDGSWGPSYNRHSVNSTGVVLQALQVSRAAAEAHAAAITAGLAFLARLQNGDGGLPVSSDPGQSDSDLRATVQGASGVLGVPFGTLSSSTPVPTRTTTDTAATAAAAWAVSQLTTGDHAETVPAGDPPTSYVLAGQSIDLAYGLLATGGHPVTVGKLLDYASLATSLRSNVNGENFGDVGSIYVGPTAKLATVLQLAGRNPRDVGEQHLDLIANTVASIGAGGRVHDTFDPKVGQDYANVFGQAFTVLALTAAGDATDAARARDGLLAVQCPDGGFPVDFPTSGASCQSVPDATGLAVQALNATHPGTTATAAAASPALANAVTWLTTHRLADGTWPGAPGTTNTTAYAGMGLLAVGQDAASSRAALRSRANADGGLPQNAAGASDFYATAQSLNLLAGASFLQLAPGVLSPATTVAAPPPPTTGAPTGGAPTTTAPGTGAAPTGTSGSAGAGGGEVPTTGASALGGGTAVSGGALPDTGADVLDPLWWAALTLLVGTGVTVYGFHRPRRAATARRH